MPAEQPVTEVVTYDEAQHRLADISRSTLQRLIREGEIQTVNIRGAKRVTAASINAYLKSIGRRARRS